MNTTRQFWLAIIGLVATSMAVPASAADLPAAPTYAKSPYKASEMVAPVYNWGGGYVGVSGGWGSSHDCLTITSAAGAAVTPNSEGCHNATGGLAGGQAGYRWQASKWVFGVEAQGDWADLMGSNASLTARIPYTNQTKIDAIGLFTGQVGYAWNNVLLYVKGGAAAVDTRYTSFFPVGNVFAAAGVPFNAANGTRWGGLAGSGVEVGFAPNWSVSLEYDHLFMGNATVTFPPTNIAVTRTDTIRQDADLVTVHVNYRWGGPAIAKY